VTLLEAPEPPSRLPSNSLLADSVARLVSAAIVEAMLVEVLLVLAAVLAGVAEAWLLLMPPIDIMAPIVTAGIRAIGRNLNNLRRSCTGAEAKGEMRAARSSCVRTIGANPRQFCTAAD